MQARVRCPINNRCHRHNRWALGLGWGLGRLGVVVVAGNKRDASGTVAKIEIHGIPKSGKFSYLSSIIHKEREIGEDITRIIIGD